MAKRGTVADIAALKEKIKQRGYVIDPDRFFGTEREIYMKGFVEAFDLLTPLLDCALKTSDHQLIGHSEPDAYTRLGCLTNVATEAIDKVKKDLRVLYNEELNVLRAQNEKERKKDEKIPWGARNPAHTKAEAEHRSREWGATGMCMDVGLWEVLGWTQHETEAYHEHGVIPKGYEPQRHK